jgi:hypothetical protein
MNLLFCKAIGALSAHAHVVREEGSLLDIRDVTFVCGDCLTSTMHSCRKNQSESPEAGELWTIWYLLLARDRDERACQEKAAVSLNQSRREGRGLVLHQCDCTVL